MTHRARSPLRSIGLAACVLVAGACAGPSQEQVQTGPPADGVEPAAPQDQGQEDPQDQGQDQQPAEPQDQPAEPQDQPQPQAPVLPNEPMTLLDMLPNETAGAVLLHTGRLRTAFRGPVLMEIIRSVGGDLWEQGLDVNIAVDVNQAIVYALPRPSGASGDLSAAVDAARDGMHGLLLELDAPRGDNGPECLPAQLHAMEPTVMSTPIQGALMRECGRFIIVQRAHPEATLVYDGVTTAEATFQASGVTQEEGPLLVLAVGPDLADHANCDGHSAQLQGWQTGMVDMSAGLALRGRYHAASQEHVPGLERCVADGLGGLGGVPLFRDLALGDLMADGRVARDPERPTDVTLDISYTPEELENVMGLLELVGEGFLGDLFH